LTPEFLSSCSRFVSLEELVDASRLNIQSKQGLGTEEWDNFIRDNTSFDGWEEMLEAAMITWTKKQLGL